MKLAAEATTRVVEATSLPRPANAASEAPAMNALQIGEGWFAERGGGLNRYYAELLGRLPAAGVNYQGLVVGSGAVGDLSEGAVQAVIASDAGLRSRFRAMRERVLVELNRDPPDVVVAHFAPYAWPVLSSIRQLPLVVHFHGPWSAESRAEGAGRASVWIKHRIERAVYQRAARLIVLSHAFAQLLSRDYGVDPARIDVIPGGVDLARFNTNLDRSEARRRLGWPLDRPIVLAVRRLVRRMGLETLIEAVETARARNPDLLVVIAGTGPLAQTLQKQVEVRQLERHVRLAGFLPDAELPLAYRAADLTVIPSISLEGFGLVAAESLASGTPAIVTRVGGLPEVIEPLAPELVVEPDDPDGLCDLLCSALAGRIPLPASKRCREYAVARFDWSSVAIKVAESYRLALKDHVFKHEWWRRTPRDG